MLIYQHPLNFPAEAATTYTLEPHSVIAAEGLHAVVAWGFSNNQTGGISPLSWFNALLRSL